MPPFCPLAGTQTAPELRCFGGLAIHTGCDIELDGLKFGDGGPRCDPGIGMDWPKWFGYPETGTLMSDGV